MVEHFTRNEGVPGSNPGVGFTGDAATHPRILAFEKSQTSVYSRDMQLIFVVIALVFAGIHLARHRAQIHGSGAVAEVFLRYWLGIAIGLGAILGALAFFADGAQIAKQICFTRGDGGFELENAMGDLAIGVGAFLCLWIRDTKYWLAVIVISSVLLLGDAYGHIHQLVVHDNHCSGNVGVTLYFDILGPLVAIILYALMRRGKRSQEPPAATS